MSIYNMYIYYIHVYIVCKADIYIKDYVDQYIYV